MPNKSRGRRAAQGDPLLSPRDFTSYLREKADQLAPGDLEPVLKQAEAAHRRAASVQPAHPRLQRQVELSLRLLDDHAAGRCPQIPFHTVSLLAVSLLYFLDPVDVIPDWIPGAGSADDAVIFELAFALGRPGIERYCTWKGINTDGLLLQPSANAGGTGKTARSAKRRAKSK
jgi:uncharacterized membrane protein YkvA (DUF1232 family)